MKNIERYFDCCSGCLACVQICPKNAIIIENNAIGFGYPKIDSKLCVECGLCDKVCQCNHESVKNDIQAVFCAKNRDEQMREKSQSGGLFSAIAKVILDSGGVCYGAALSDDLSVIQYRIDNEKDLYKLQGSKYVQSFAGQSFADTAEDLKNNRLVLYSGTSCIVDGLIRYLNAKKIDTDKLYTADIICHGVLSPVMYKENLQRIEKKYGSKVEHVNFRDKSHTGWHGQVETYMLSDGRKVHDTAWAGLMQSCLAKRNCCHVCNYSLIESKQADITMADFWGMNEILDFMREDEKGYSLAIIHTRKGKELFDKANLETEQVNLEKYNMKRILKYNRLGIWPTPKQYYNFAKDYDRYGYFYALKKYTEYGGIRFKIKRKVMKLFNRW